MCVPNELRFGIHVQNPVAIPMMPSACNQQLRMQICVLRIHRIPHRRIIGVIADVQPHILITVNMRQAICTDVVATIEVIPPELRRRWDRVVLAARERPVAPLLSIVHLQHTGD